MRLKISHSLLFLGVAFILALSLVSGNFAQKPRRHKQLSLIAACLPAGVKVSDIVVYGFNAEINVTVAEKVKELRGRCRNRQLVGPDKKRIRFFRTQCWGYPPPDYEQIRAEEKRQLEVLKAKHTVIVLGCDPRLPSRPESLQPLPNPGK